MSTAHLKRRPNDERIAILILELCEERAPHKTICPSEVARELEITDGDWRTHMDDVRRIGFDLMKEGKILVTQRGGIVHSKDVRGPIRFGLIATGR